MEIMTFETPVISRRLGRAALVSGVMFAAIYGLSSVHPRALNSDYAAMVSQSSMRLRDVIAIGGRYSDGAQETMVAAANAQGAAHPRPTGPVAEALRVQLGIAGALVDRRCVTVVRPDAPRSGEITWATGAGYRRQWMNGIGKSAWRVQYDGFALNELDRPNLSSTIIRAVRLDRKLAPGLERRSRSPYFTGRRGDTLVFSVNGAGTQGMVVPTPGRWMFITTSGPNWGCFIYTV
jgi:hypothetical protein